MDFSRKSQAAMEFVMTYGWVILVLLAAIASLAYFGLLKPDMLLPESCAFSSGIACTGFKLTSNSFVLMMTNMMSKDVYLNEIDIGGCSVSGLNQTWKSGETTTVTYSGCDFSAYGSRLSSDIIVTYAEKEAGLSKSIIGTIKSKIADIEDIGAGEPEEGEPEEGEPEEDEPEETLTPVTLTPILAESYQDEVIQECTVTSVVTALDDDWAPKACGTVGAPYYATGTSTWYFDALAVKFSTGAYDPALYDATLRFYLKDGTYSKKWRHYKVYDDYKDNSECIDTSPPCGGSPSFKNKFEGWIEVPLDDSYWDDGELSIRLWDALIDKVELYLEPIE